MKRKSAGKNQDVANFWSASSAVNRKCIGQKQTPAFKDEDELFGTLTPSQMRQIAPERKVVAKMQISNNVYQEMLAPFNSMPLSYTGERASWKYPQQQAQELHQAQHQHHNFRDVRNQTQKPFHIPFCWNHQKYLSWSQGNFSIKISLRLDFVMILSKVLKYFKMSLHGCCFKHFDNLQQNIVILWVWLSIFSLQGMQLSINF